MTKQKSKKSITLVFIIALTLLLSSMPAGASIQVFEYDNNEHGLFLTAEEHEHLVMEKGLEFVTNYTRSLALLNAMFESLPVSRMGDIMYPDNFGGVFVGDDGVLVVSQVAGERIYARRPRAGSLGPPVSAGFRAWNGTNGFITAQHTGFAWGFGGLRAGDYFNNWEGRRIGTVRTVNATPMDAAFVQLESNMIFSQTPLPRFGSNVRGTMVFSMGHASTTRSGSVVDPWQGTLNTGQFVIAIQAGFRSIGGDSGGIVWSAGGVNGIFVASWPGGDSLFTEARGIAETLRISLN